MSEKIAIITTGGTIGSVIEGTSVAIDSSGLMLRDEIDRVATAHAADIEVVTSINKHSEDIDPADWSTILQTVENCLARGVTRIIITHGTDTLPYTAAAVELLFGGVGARICLTGSFYSLEHPHTDVPLNLISAFRCVASNDLPEGVYVAFRTTAENKFASIIPASDLKPMQFDDVAFRGIYGLAAATYELHGQFKTNLRSSPIIRPWLGGKVPSKGKVRDASKRVAQIVAYPGLDLSPYASHVGLAALVVSLYHSGTASSQIPDGGLLEFLSKRPQVAVMLAAYPAQHLDRPYESTLRLIRAGALVYRDLQPHVLHVALALALAQGRHTEDVAKALSPWSYENSGKATHNSRSATDLARSIFS